MATEYVVLSNTDAGGPRWQHIGVIEARSADSAIREWINREEILAEDASGSYVAVPARSWKPVSVKVETKTALHFS